MSEKIRLHQLAKELGVSSAEIVEFCHKLGLKDIKTHASTVDEQTANQIKAKYKKPPVKKPSKPTEQPEKKPGVSQKSDKVKKDEISLAAPPVKPVEKTIPPSKPTQPQSEPSRAEVKPIYSARPTSVPEAKPVVEPSSKPPVSTPTPQLTPKKPTPAVKPKYVQIPRAETPRTARRKEQVRILEPKRPVPPAPAPSPAPVITPSKPAVDEIPPKPWRKVQIGLSPTLHQLATKLDVKVNDLIKKAMQHKWMISINQRLDETTAKTLASSFGVELELIDTESEDYLLTEELDEADAQYSEPRAPVVTIMGHVDHGKTSLLDAIRKTNVTEDEFGGITQHIGAYDVSVSGKDIVFLDTPGHEAFTAMRARGAKVTDLVVLVVSAVEGVMPQTVEAIHHAQAAQVPILVAVNKIDLPEANPIRVKQQLMEHNLVPEEWGGKTIFVEVSAKKKIGIEQLLEMILLEAEMLELKGNPRRRAVGVVIEARLDKGRGPIATVLVQNGTLKIGDAFVCGLSHGKVRAMFNDKGQPIHKAGPAKPAEVIGFSAVPAAGDRFQAVSDERIAKAVCAKRLLERREKELHQRHHVTLDDLYTRVKAGEIKELLIILKADVQGSLEALQSALLKQSTDEIQLRIIHSAVGAITESDVLLASASDAIIVGFNVRPEPKAVELAAQEKVDIRIYRIIYEAISEIRAALVGMLEPEYREVVQGRAEIRQVFKTPKLGNVAGCYVSSGKISRNAKIRLIRDNVVIHEGNIASLRRFKEDVREVTEGYECGILLENYNDIREKDWIEAFVLEEIPRKL
ncbi:MAG: translation initiation factor IF-2 [bacterium]|nr:translation initiation factor IF-2 [bacterium]